MKPTLVNLLALPALSFGLAAGCGDNTRPMPIGGEFNPPDAGGNPDGPDLTAGKVAVVAGDFQATGVVSTIDAPSLAVAANAVAGIASSDPVIRRIGDELFVVNRFGGDNITLIDAVSLALVDQFATGSGSNPQDVAVVGNKLYVAAGGTGAILVIDRDQPTPVGEIDLSTLDDDGNPDCVSIYAVGTRVFAACGLLDNFQSVENGKVVVIDTSNDTVVDTIDLPARNPYGFLEQAPVGSTFAGDLLMPTIPSYTEFDEGCLARVPTSGNASATASCAVTNEVLGGFVQRVAAHGDALWTIVTAFDENFTASGSLVRIDLATGSASAALTPGTMVAQDVAACGGHVFVADKADGAQGIRVYRVDGAAVGELTSAALDVGLPPLAGQGLACMIVPL